MRHTTSLSEKMCSAETREDLQESATMQTSDFADALRAFQGGHALISAWKTETHNLQSLVYSLRSVSFWSHISRTPASLAPRARECYQQSRGAYVTDAFLIHAAGDFASFLRSPLV